MRFLKKAFNSVAGRAAMLAGAASVATQASAEVVLPDNGVDTSGFLTAGIAIMGGVVATAVGGYITFLVVRKGMAWAGTAFGQKSP